MFLIIKEEKKWALFASFLCLFGFISFYIQASVTQASELYTGIW